MKTVERPLEQLRNSPEMQVERHPKFERSISIVNSITQAVVGYITVATAREIAEWVSRFKEER